MRRVTLRIVPFFDGLLFHFLSDRVNLGFAALQMVEDLPFLCDGIRVRGRYFLRVVLPVRVPSNLLLESSAPAGGSRGS